MKILIVDSDRDLIEMLGSWLKNLGYDMYRASTSEQARIEWIERLPELVIVDTALQDGDMLAVCNELRAHHDALVLVITDGKDVQDEVRCLESGADDYLRKPFYPAQLLAHIRAVSRRTRNALRESQPSSTVTVGPVFIDLLQNEVSIHGKIARLTPTECKMLHLLAINAEEICTAEQIVSYVWGYTKDSDAGLIKAHIRHLRQKIEPDPSHPIYIKTVPSAGYKLIRHRSELTTPALRVV